MKTKNKILAMVEIAIVLCSVFLVALPAIAADQNQEMQKVSASEVTTASEDDYVLDIYGNANEDDTIDMGDVVYTKLAIFGKKPKTKLCDAKYDGRINVLDVIQAKLIILGKEKELTLIDTGDRIVTVKKPVERVVTLLEYSAEVMRIFRTQDKIVGIGSGITECEIYFPELSKLPSVGRWGAPDYEAILSLNPDLVIPLGSKTAKHAKKLPGVAVVGLSFYKPETLVEELEKLGYILEREEEANAFIDWYEGYRDTIEGRTEDIPEVDRPRVYIETAGPDEKWKTAGSESGWHQKIEIAGGHNIFGDIPTSRAKVDPEEVIKRNPEIIIRRMSRSVCGWVYNMDPVDGITKYSAIRDEIMSRPELAKVSAVKDRKVYITHMDFSSGFNHLACIAYIAKWFHPELFEDLNPKAIHQEYIKFQGLPDDFLDTHGVFVYHPEEHPDGR